MVYGLTNTPQVNAPISENIHTKEINFTYKWTTTSFSNNIRDVVNIWTSPTFSACSNDPKTWCLRAVLRKNRNYFSLYLKLISCDVSEIGVKFELFIVHPETEENVCMQPQKEHVFVSGESCGFQEFTSYDFLLNRANYFIHDDKLTLGCKVSILPHCNISNTATEPFKLPNCKLSADLGNLFESEKFSDVTLTVDGKEIKAHKAILAARSAVFAAMFEHQMEERKLNRVAITDIDYEVLKEMVGFIYTGKAPNIDKMADQLLAAADKYALENLKIRCEKEVFGNLSIETAAETLSFADLHSAHQLKMQTIDFINNNATNVIETQGWRNVVNTNSNLIAEAFQAFVTQKIEPPTKRQKVS